jgi:hypothetical protein
MMSLALALVGVVRTAPWSDGTVVLAKQHQRQGVGPATVELELHACLAGLAARE